MNGENLNNFLVDIIWIFKGSHKFEDN